MNPHEIREHSAELSAPSIATNVRGSDSPASSPHIPGPSRLRRFFWSTDRRRLASYLTLYAGELAELRQQQAAGSQNAWTDAARHLIDRAYDAVRSGDVNTGWNCYNAAKRLEVLSFDDSRRRALTRALRFEASEKVDAWRRQAIAKLLSEPDDPGTAARDVSNSITVRQGAVSTTQPQVEPMSRPDATGSPKAIWACPPTEWHRQAAG
jgi:hypothetical protein